MNTLLVCLGLALGVVLPWAAAWLLVVYPWSEVSLKPFWYSLGVGLAFGVFGLLGGLALWASYWPQD